MFLFWLGSDESNVEWEYTCEAVTKVFEYEFEGQCLF